MRSQGCVAARATCPRSANVPAIESVAAFLLRVERHERDGLSRRLAILAASSDLGMDAARVMARAACDVGI